MSVSEPRSHAPTAVIMVIIGLGVVVIANAIMISLALLHPSVPATNDHWAESLDWDRELERRAHSRELGWSIATIAREQQALELQVVDAEQRPLAGLRGQVTLRRADSNADDRTLTLIELDEGRYRSEPSLPDAGLYELSVTLHDAEGDEFVERRWLQLRGTP
jgi:nitrogen fixation protein FixH